MTQDVSYRFGPFTLTPATRELRCGGEEVPLSPKALGCVLYLLEHREQAVDRNELIDAVWGREQLGDGVLGQAIFLARRALDDNGDEARYIKTVRGYGYRWVAPVDVVSPPAPPRTTPFTRGRAWLAKYPAAGRWAAVILLVGLLLGVIVYPGLRTPLPDPSWPARGDGEIALLLPVQVEADADHGWVRLGVMDLLAERLREAGQVMVPSDTVIALLRGDRDQPGEEELARLSDATGTYLILAARARQSGSRWTVSLHSVAGAQPPLAAVAEDADVLVAARAAADHMAEYLGLTPAPAPDGGGELQRLLRQIEAALLAQRMDEARARIESADPALRELPEVRFQSGRVAFYGHHLDVAKAEFQPLLEQVSAADNPELRARVLNGLGTVHAMQGERETAMRMMEEAVELLVHSDLLDTMGVLRMNLGNLAQEQGDFMAAREHMAQAQRILQGIGDVQRLAALDVNIGVMESRRDRHGEALRYYRRGAERHAAVRNVAGELHALATMMEAQLWLLHPQAALALEPRVLELLTETENIHVTAFAGITRAATLAAVGRVSMAESVLEEVSEEIRVRADLQVYRMMMDLLRAEWLLAEDTQPGEAARLAAAVVDGLADEPHMYERRAHAGLLLVRAQLAQEETTAAEAAVAALAAWTAGGEMPAPRVHAALAEAELAAAGGRVAAAEAAYERALALADTGHSPLRLLQVAQRYVPWLLREKADAKHALLVANRVAGYSDQHYQAALLQLRVYQALGPVSTWRAALGRTRALAGERPIPPELLTAPEYAPE